MSYIWQLFLVNYIMVDISRFKKLKVLLLLITVFNFYIYPNKILSQETIGLSMDNYSGVWGANINPGILTQQKTFVNVNILGAAFHFSNNFAYIPSKDSAFFGPFPIDTVKPTYGEFYYNGYFDYYKNKKQKWYSISQRIMGPSFNLQINNHVFGISTAIRTYGSANHFPWEIPVIAYEDMDYKPLHNIRFDEKDFDLNELVWEELNFTYANEFYNKHGNSFSAGITGKVLFGISAVYNTYKAADFKIIDNYNVFFYKLDTDVGYAVSDSLSDLSLNLLNPFKASGHGVGADIGIVYTKKKNNKADFSYSKRRICSYNYSDYLFRIGLSIIDIGKIKFKKNAGLHRYYIKNTFLNIDSIPNFNTSSMEEYFRSISNILTGDPDSSFVSNEISIGLPTALSLQFDWHIDKPYYISTLFIQPIRLNNKSIRRPSQIVITPRYETAAFGVSLPISLLQYETFRTGLAFRIYGFTIGTESLGTLLDFRNLDNMDIYFSFKFYLEKGKCNPNKMGACDFNWK